MRELTDDLAPDEMKILQDVAEQGVHVVHVPMDGDGPGYSFTIGLWHHYQQPEVVVFGLPDDVTIELLNVLADEADDGKRFRGGEKHSGLLVDYPVRFVDVPKDKVGDYLGAAQWAYEGADFPCVQLVWPDKQKRWPWDEGVREGFAASQPILGPRES